MSIVLQHPAFRERTRQFLTALLTRSDPEIDRAIRRALDNEEQWELVHRLPAFDRRHVWRVYCQLQQQGWDDRDLLRAALLHDVGKADEKGRVWLLHRVAHVLGNAVSPRSLRWLANYSHGVCLALNHARLGAELAREAGASERCCWLIENHEGPSAGDPQLLALIEADRGAS